MFKVNDIVVYRRIVCRIVGKHRSDFTKEMCYILVPYHADEGSTRMQVPIANKAGHLRALITKEEIEELKAAREKPIVFDEDCPETTPERAMKFRRVNPPRAVGERRA